MSIITKISSSRAFKLIMYLLLTTIIVGFSTLMKSDFLIDFLKEQILSIIITLLAINTATYSFLLSKISEINPEHNHFSNVFKEIKLSLAIQFILIIVAIFLLISFESQLLKCLPYKDIIFEFLFCLLFVCALDLLRDTGFAIFSFNNISYEKED